MTSQTDHLLCGWRLRSALPLPELIPWPGPMDAPVDVRVEAARLPERIDGVAQGEHLTISADGSALLSIPGCVRILAKGGDWLGVDRLGDDPNEVWRLFLLGSGLGVLCHQRGLYPLHAASLRLGARTLAIMGPSGAGKSTLALALARRGCDLLSDDVTVLSMESDGAQLLPAYPRLKLWSDSLASLGVASDGLARVRSGREGLEKFDLQPRQSFESAPARLDAVVLLGEAPQPALRRLSPLAAASALRANVFRLAVGRLMGRDAALFAQSVALAASTPVYVFERPKRFSALDAGAALIHERFAA